MDGDAACSDSVDHLFFNRRDLDKVIIYNPILHYIQE